MVNASNLQRECSRLLKEKTVLATGILVIHVNYTKAPKTEAEKQAEFTADVVDLVTDGPVADIVDGITVLRTTHTANQKRHQAYKNEAMKQGLTPVMVCAVTKRKIYLLDWTGNVRSGSGPSKVLLEFDRSSAVVNVRNELTVKDITISDGGCSVRAQINFGLLSPNKPMNRKLVNELRKTW